MINNLSLRTNNINKILWVVTEDNNTQVLGELQRMLKVMLLLCSLDKEETLSPSKNRTKTI